MYENGKLAAIGWLTTSLAGSYLQSAVISCMRGLAGFILKSSILQAKDPALLE
jgi:hypothetical protein